MAEEVLVLTVLLRYRLVIDIGRRGGPLLTGLAAGAVLVAAVALATPAGTPDTSRLDVGGAALARTVPSPGAVVPSPLAVPSVTVPPPVTPAATPNSPPPPTTTEATIPEATTGTPAPERVDAAVEVAPEPDPPASGAGFAAAVIAATNLERAAAGCDDLRTDSRLTAAAQGHSEDMAEHGYFSHTGRDGSSFADRISAQGHPAPGGENIALGQSGAAEVVTAWMNSPGHRANILDCSFTSIGVGFDGRGSYWTQDFGR